MTLIFKFLLSPLQGQRVPMNQQLRNHQETVNKVATLLGNRTAAENHLRRCIYIISEGNNDYLNNYYFPATPAARILYTPEKFADKLIQQFSQQLTVSPSFYIHNANFILFLILFF